MDACAFNMGHCLWFGLVDEDKAPLVAEKLMSPQMFSGWGVRSLATEMGAYNPASYHNGWAWPHDNATIAAGLVGYGFVKEAQQIAAALLEAAQYSDGRLPELFCGFDRERFTQPVPYPTACSPQTWAATASILLVTSLMRYDAHVSRGGLWLDPVLPEAYGDLHITNAPHGWRPDYHRHFRFHHLRPRAAQGHGAAPRAPALDDRTGGTGQAAQRTLAGRAGPTASWATRHVTSCSPQAGGGQQQLDLAVAVHSIRATD